MNVKDIAKELASLRRVNFNMYAKDFLLTTEKTDDDLLAVLKLAEILKALYSNNISTKFFNSGLAIAQFRDKSTRTRFSFASASNLLGLALQELDETKTKISHG